jgi:poly(A) polymerase
MKLKDFLLIIKKLAQENGISEPYLVGGIPRDKLLNQLNKMEDLDITTGDDGIHQLAELIAAKLPNWTFKKMDDGHSSIFLDPLKLDFSSNFIINNVEKIVGKTLNTLEKEMWSRDFTCNALLLNFDLSQIKDPTGFGIKDIHSKLLRTCLDPAITLGVDPRRIIRIIYLATKLNFSIDREIIKWVKEHPSLIKDVKPEYLNKKWGQCLKLNHDKAIQLAKDLNVLEYLPLHAEDFRSVNV